MAGVVGKTSTPPNTKLKGSLETKRPSSNDQSFNEYLAGVIDGDGSLLISKAGYCCLEITVETKDIGVLQHIQENLGGSIKPRSGVDAVRYRLHNTASMVDVVHRVNGLIRNTPRVVQLKNMCEHLGIAFVFPSVPLTDNSAWYSGSGLPMLLQLLLLLAWVARNCMLVESLPRLVPSA